MPPSQLKRLKTSLRDKGVVGQQKSKKQNRQASKNGSAREGRIQRNTALQSIREQFNPFDVRAPVRVKHEVTDSRTVRGTIANGIVGRPGITKSLGEEKVGFGRNHNRASLLMIYLASENTASRDATEEESGRDSGSEVWGERSNNDSRGEGFRALR